ncbi:MAG: hypothetical protein JJT94_12160 [Bernardetiaceae bacterium]|nr:hypothetical protein [Bernardetiaceae bacterium]
MLQKLSVLSGKVYRKLTLHKPKEKLSVSDFDRSVLAIPEGSAQLQKELASAKPFFAGRFGSVELSIVRSQLKYKAYQQLSLTGKIQANFAENRSIHFPQGVRDSAHNNAGIFPKSDAVLEKYSQLFLEDVPILDMLGVWFNPYEEVLARDYGSKNLTLMRLQALEPYYHTDASWSSALAGKKVLVIHPYKESIESQYAKRADLFPNTDILPEFELKTMRAVQSIAGNKTPFDTWFDALEAMKNQMEKIDFDVMLVGAGAYGFHLAAHAKRMGKQGIHIGGATQILFGIKGARWDEHPVISKFYNEHWVRPQTSEIPANHKKVEDGCYW